MGGRASSPVRSSEARPLEAQTLGAPSFRVLCERVEPRRLRHRLACVIPTSEPASNRVIAGISPPPILSFHVPRSRPAHSPPPLLRIRLVSSASGAGGAHAPGRTRHLRRHAAPKSPLPFLS